MKRTSLLLATLWICLPSLGFAQTILTWEDCVKESSARNLNFLAAQQSLKSAENSHLSSLGQFMPQISLGASTGRSGSDNSLDGILGNPGYKQSAGFSLSVKQAIFSGLSDIASVDSANAQVRSARAQLRAAKAQLSRDLTAAFYGLLFSQRQVILLGKISERSKSNSKLVELHYKGGTDNKGSYLQAEASALQADYELAQAKRSLRVAQRQLAGLLDRDPLKPLEAKGEFDLPLPPSEIPDFRKLALDTPSYLLAEAQLHTAESRLLSARGGFLPTLSANASFSKSGQDFGNLSPNWSAGLSLSLPLLSGGSDIFDYKAAEESKKGSEYDLKNAATSAAEKIESAHAGLQNAAERVTVQRAFLKSAQIREQIAKAEYLNGLLNFQNWDQIESDLTSQEKAELSSLLSAKTAQADWELSQGKGVIP